MWLICPNPDNESLEDNYMVAHNDYEVEAFAQEVARKSHTSSAYIFKLVEEHRIKFEATNLRVYIHNNGEIKPK